MAGRGIGIKVFADLDMAALAAVIGQMKSAFGGVGREIDATANAQLAAVKKLENEMVMSANRAARAEIDAEKMAGEAILAERRRVNAAKVAEDKRTVAQQRAILMAPVAEKRSAQADKEAEAAADRKTAAEEAHAEALAKSGNAANAASVAYNRAGMAVTGGLAFGLGEAIKQAGEFDNKLQQMGAATDESAGQIKALHDQLLQLGPQVGRSLDELVSGAYMAAKSNFKDTATQIDLVRTAAQLAAIEGAPLENTMKALTTTMNDFSVPAGNAAKVASMIKAAAGDAKVTLDEFAGSVHNLEPIFKSLVGGDQSKSMPFLAQQNAMLAMMTQSGAGADQSSQWIRNTMMHLVGAQAATGQRQAIGQLGGSFDQMVKDVRDPNIGPLGVMKQINQLISAKLGPDGMVQLDKFFRNKDAVKQEYTNYEDLPDELKAIADQVQSGKLDSMMAMRKAANIGPDSGKMKAWLEAHNTLTGFDPLMKKYQGTEGTIEQLVNAALGSQSGFLTYSTMMGSPEARAQLDQVLADQQNANPENGGKDVGGWSAVADTLGVKTKQLNASLQDMAASVGQNLLPYFKDFVDTLKSISNFFKDHQGLLHEIITLSESFVALWVGSKLMGGLKSISGMFREFGTLLRGVKSDATQTADAVGNIGTSAGTIQRNMGGLSRFGGAMRGLGNSLRSPVGSMMLMNSGMDLLNAPDGSGGTDWWGSANQALMGGGMMAGGPWGWAAAAAGGVSALVEALYHGAQEINTLAANRFNIDKLTPDNAAMSANGLPGTTPPPQGFWDVMMRGLTPWNWGKEDTPPPGWEARRRELMDGKNPSNIDALRGMFPDIFGNLPNPSDLSRTPAAPGLGGLLVPGAPGAPPGAPPIPNFVIGAPGGPASADPNLKALFPGVNPGGPPAPAPPPAPTMPGPDDGLYHPEDYMGPGLAAAGAGGKGKKGKRSQDEVNADLAAMGISPDGTANDPLYISDVNDPTGHGRSAGNLPGEKGGNPFDAFTHPDGLWGKNGLLGDVAGLMTTFLGELALGNPLGQMMNGNVSNYAWWAGDGKGNKLQNSQEKLAISANETANALDRLKETLRTHDKDSPEARIALRNYQDAQMREAMAGRRGGRGAALGNLGNLGNLGLGPGGDSYGLPQGTDIRQGAPGFPDWVYELGQKFGLTASTYSGHQETGGASGQIKSGQVAPNPFNQNRGIDWWGSQENMDRFAEFLQQTGLAEQVIHSDPNTGQKFGFPFGVDYSGSWHDEEPMVHTRFSRSPFGPLMGPGAAPGPNMVTGPNGAVISQGHATGTPSVVPGQSSTVDDHLAMLPGGGLIGLAGGEGILNAAAAGALGPNTINALNAMGSSAKLFGFAGGDPAVGADAAAAGVSAPPIPKLPTAIPGGLPGGTAGSTQPQGGDSKTGSTQDASDTGAQKPGSAISGGAIGAAEGAAAMAADAFAPGSGAVVQLVEQEMNRAIQFGGQAAATLIGEMPIETFGLTGNDLSGRSVSLMKSLPGKIVGGIMGSHPNLPNNAGKSGQGNGGLGDNLSNTLGGMSQSQGNTNVQQGDYTGVNIENMNFSGSQDSSDMVRGLHQASMGVGGQMWDRSPTGGTG